jgi:hypothetical protein
MNTLPRFFCFMPEDGQSVMLHSLVRNVVPDTVA